MALVGPPSLVNSIHTDTYLYDDYFTRFEKCTRYAIECTHYHTDSGCCSRSLHTAYGTWHACHPWQTTEQHSLLAFVLKEAPRAIKITPDHRRNMKTLAYVLCVDAARDIPYVW